MKDGKITAVTVIVVGIITIAFMLGVLLYATDSAAGVI